MFNVSQLNFQYAVPSNMWMLTPEGNYRELSQGQLSWRKQSEHLARDRGHNQMGARRVAGQGHQGRMSSNSDSPVLHEISKHVTHTLKRPCPPESPCNHGYIVYRGIGHELSPQQAISAKRSKTAQNGKKNGRALCSARSCNYLLPRGWRIPGHKTAKSDVTSLSSLLHKWVNALILLINQIRPVLKASCFK
ncbi:hypothetical protein DFH09DRAFT_1070306 [Mycena vulgaris]|nr:hypothetical protein DFH09DRAFT_1070306 [Mycena vulgaris]